jgi:hypothetical protein
LADIINFYEENYVIRFYQQIIQKSIATNSIFVVDDFNKSYDFSDVLYSYRNSSIRGSFMGDVVINNGVAHIIGKANFDFFDEFKDPVSIAQLTVEVRNYFSFLKDIPEKDLSDILVMITNIWQKPYPITDSWTNDIDVFIKL